VNRLSEAAVENIMKNHLINTICFMFLAWAAFAGPQEEVPLASEPSGIENTDPLPLLRTAQSLGMIEGYNPSNPPATQAAIASSWEEAQNRGLAIGRLQIDWPELETAPGVYDQEVLERELMGMLDRGLQTFLLISAFDSEGPVFPRDLRGKSIDDPEVISRFKSLMDWVIPMLSARGGYAISISNEADNWFGELPDLPDRLLTFLRETRAHIKDLNPRMAVTVTHAVGNLFLYRDQVLPLVEASDLGAWNFYGSKPLNERPYTAPMTEAEIRQKAQNLLELTGESQLIIQELGMHSGGGLGASSLREQTEFFRVFGEIMDQEPRIRTAYVWQMVDWSPELSMMYTDLLRDEEIDPAFLQMFQAVLQSIGLIDYATGEQKPAWQEFLRWVDHFSQKP
jgi:hypothetical protein